MIKETIGAYSIIKSSNFCKCPFHSDTKGVMYIDEWNDVAICPVCNKSWTPVSFVADKKRIPYYEAYAQVHGVSPQENWKDDYNAIEKIANLYMSHYEGSDGERYMFSRGVDEYTAKYYKLGWNKNERRVVFPIANTYGKIAGFTARAIEDGVLPKYKNSKNSSIFQKKRVLYGFDPNFIYDSYILVEGQMDVIKLQSIGYSNVVCSSGTAINRDQLILLPKVYILYDQDDAGIKATERVVRLCDELSIPYEVVTLPSGKDPDEFISEGGDISIYLTYEVSSKEKDKTDRLLYLSAFTAIDEKVVEDSVISKSWIKVASDTVLQWYLANLFVDIIRYTIQKELKFRKGGDSGEIVDIDQLKSSIPIEMVISSYGIGVPQSRMNIPCPLPEHKDGTPSFAINKQHNLFKCFGCNKGGSQIDFIKEMEKCDTQTAINKLKSFL